MSFAVQVAVVVSILAVAPAGGQPRRGPGGRPPGPPPRQMIDELKRMSPSQREGVLSKLPRERRSLVEQRLEKLDRLTPDARQRLGDEYVLFQQLPEEKQEQMRRLFRQFSQLSEDRRTVLRREMLGLRGASATARTARLASDSFEADYDEHERTLLKSLIEVLPPLQ